MGRHSVGEDRSFVRSVLFFVLKWVGLALIPLLLVRVVWGIVTPNSTSKPRTAARSSPAPSPIPEATPTAPDGITTSPGAAAGTGPTAAGPGPKLQVLNGTSKVGQAQALATLLRRSGREVVKIEKAAKSYDKTTIFYQPGFEAAAHDLAGTLGAQVQAAPEGLSKDIPLTVVVGADYTPPDAAAAPAAGPSPTAAPNPATSPTSASTPTTTSVTAQVLNGTDVKGLAGRAAEKLRNKGYEIVAVKNAVNMYDHTTVYFQPGFQRNASEVVAVLGTGTVRQAPASLQKDIPVTVVVGKDYS